jgi:TIR domain-containing protein
MMPVVPSPATKSRRFGVFLSQSQDDRGPADRIAGELRQIGLPVWYAPWSIKAGESIPGKVNEALEQNNMMVVLLSPRSVSSRWVKMEWESALAATYAGEDMTVVPVLIDPVQVPAILLGIRRIDMTPGRFEAGFAELTQLLVERRLSGCSPLEQIIRTDV